MSRLSKVFLILVSVHSLCVGVGLVTIPLEYFGIFGFESYQGNLFKIQGGVFHIVMCGAYIPAALDPVRNIVLVRFSVFAKFTATLFLLLFVFLEDMVWMVLASGILDFIIGMMLLWFYRKLMVKSS